MQEAEEMARQVTLMASCHARNGRKEILPGRCLLQPLTHPCCSRAPRQERLRASLSCQRGPRRGFAHSRSGWDQDLLECLKTPFTWVFPVSCENFVFGDIHLKNTAHWGGWRPWRTESQGAHSSPRWHLVWLLALPLERGA